MTDYKVKTHKVSYYTNYFEIFFDPFTTCKVVFSLNASQLEEWDYSDDLIRYTSASIQAKLDDLWSQRQTHIIQYWTWLSFHIYVFMRYEINSFLS